jgi:hypothetical protein
MNMTVAELLEKLLAKNVLVTFENDIVNYINNKCIVNVNGNIINGIFQYENKSIFIEFDDQSGNQYYPGEIVSVYFYRLEEL